MALILRSCLRRCRLGFGQERRGFRVRIRLGQLWIWLGYGAGYDVRAACAYCGFQYHDRVRMSAWVSRLHESPERTTSPEREICTELRNAPAQTGGDPRGPRGAQSFSRWCGQAEAVASQGVQAVISSMFHAKKRRITQNRLGTGHLGL
jgi:hypothetical protein